MKSSTILAWRAASVWVCVPLVATVTALSPALLRPALAQAQPAQATQRKTCLEFSELFMSLEQNATDGDTEVVLFVKGQDVGLKRLVVTSPEGKTILAFHGSGKGVGIREFVLESAEPPDLDAVLRSFPQGQYTVSGRTVDGQCVTGTASLSHQLAPVTTLLTPTDEQVVPIDQVLLSWEPVAHAERYIVELNNETTGSEFTFQLFPPTTSLAIPAHFLQPNSEYQFGVGVKTANGNLTVSEHTFFTAP